MDEFPISRLVSGSPSVAGFRGTQFVAVWAGSTQAIKGRLFGVNGVPSDAEFMVNFPGTPGTKRQLPRVVETGQGFAVVWIEKPVGAPALVKLRTFDQDTLSGPETEVSTAEPEPLVPPVITRIAD